MPTSIRESDSASRPGALRRLTRQRGAVLGLVILSLLASMAGLASAQDTRGIAVGERIEDEARAGLLVTVVDGRAPRSFLGRLRAALAAA